ncbi:MAG: hypothetical protein PHR68_01340 [Candidatus Gracilibacteria bacterium]|nr:hypothetical protein [Candidatus Gracilibacteria bacterium]
MLNKISILGVKKIILILVFGFILFGGNVFADDSSTTDGTSSSSSSEGIQVHVSEDIPGAGCVGSPGDYTCTVKPGFKTVMQLMGGIIKYFTYLAALGGVLFIVINGLMLSMGSMGGNKDEIKKKITMTIGGLILLLLSGLILNAIAPWIYK